MSSEKCKLKQGDTTPHLLEWLTTTIADKDVEKQELSCNFCGDTG